MLCLTTPPPTLLHIFPTCYCFHTRENFFSSVSTLGHVRIAIFMLFSDEQQQQLRGEWLKRIFFSSEWNQSLGNEQLLFGCNEIICLWITNGHISFVHDRRGDGGEGVLFVGQHVWIFRLYFDFAVNSCDIIVFLFEIAWIFHSIFFSPYLVTPLIE